MGFIAGTEAWKNKDKYGVKWQEGDDDGFEWWNQHSDLPKRYDRWLRMRDHASNLGFFVNDKWLGNLRYLNGKLDESIKNHEPLE